ncbi:MAG: DUF1462 family protein [Sporolactobacillus sp.]
MILTVYGTEDEEQCASCAPMPSSRATAEWLQAALSRTFGGAITVRYISINHPENEQDRQFCLPTEKEAFFYPLIVCDGQVIGEGVSPLRPIRRYIEQCGLKPVNPCPLEAISTQ